MLKGVTLLTFSYFNRFRSICVFNCAEYCYLCSCHSSESVCIRVRLFCANRRPSGGDDSNQGSSAAEEEMRKQPPQSKGKNSTRNSSAGKKYECLLQEVNKNRASASGRSTSSSRIANCKSGSGIVKRSEKNILPEDPVDCLKVDKSGSPRVTLRLHQLKNRGEEKKDRNSGGKNSTTDADSYENSGSVESGGKATSNLNMEETLVKEGAGNNCGGGNNEENQATSETSHDPSVQSDVCTSQPTAGGDALEQQSSATSSSNVSSILSPSSGGTSENNVNNNSQSNNSNNNNGNNNLINNTQNNGNNNNNNNNSNNVNNINNSGGGFSSGNNNSGNNNNNSGNNSNVTSSSGSSNNLSSNGSNNSSNSSNKRHVSTDDDEENKKKRRKEENLSTSRGKGGSTTGGSPKSTGGAESEGEENVKSVESPGPKVPPLKIVIPSLESEQGTRNGKSTTRHHQALPYIVARSEPGDTIPTSSSLSSIPPSTSPPTTAAANNSDQDNGTSLSADEQRSHQRVLRSSHRSGGGSSGAPSGSSSPVNPDNPSPQHASPPPSEPIPSEPPPEEKQPTDPPDPPPAPVDLHPRKRKLKPRDTNPTSESSENTSSSTVHTDQPMTNCYQLFLNIRKQIDRRRKGLFPVQPKPPQGFKDYLMNRCTYVLAGNASSRMTIPQVAPPTSLQGGMKDLFIEQEKERYRLRMQHVIEKEKLVLSVEQEILRVHGRAARALANQALPFSACTILRDEEIYSAITPEQEEKDRNARSRYNGRLFLSWLQDVDDKWEKIKEAMLLRHHNEAESLHAVQKMDWEWKLKELGLCEFKARPTIEDSHVPMVHVSDDFDLLPA